MGCYATLRINNLELYSSSREVDPHVMILYTKSDKYITVPDDSLDCEAEDFDESNVLVQYIVSLAVAKDRLEFMGFTLNKCRRLFYEALKEEIVSLKEEVASNRWDSFKEMIAIKNKEIEVLENLTFEAWVEAFTYIIKNDIKLDIDYWFSDDPKAQELPMLLRYMLGYKTSGIYGFPTYDYRVCLRAIVEIVGTDAELIYDISELVEGEYIDIYDDLCAYARWQLAEDFVFNHKIIVLTEGSSDRWAIQGALQLLYPHLADYYSFMDFDEAKVQGGAGHLASTVKSFFGAGIVNRVIAIFDNDTAAKSAVRSLQHIKTDNVKILYYPELEMAKNYPTLGPQGTTDMDINGLACSLELYFGVDILKENDGALCPIQWRGYDDAVKQYQGEVMKKDMLKARYAEKLKRCQAEPNLIDKYDWSGMKAIIDCLLTAFHEN